MIELFYYYYTTTRLDNKIIPLLALCSWQKTYSEYSYSCVFHHPIIQSIINNYLVKT